MLIQLGRQFWQAARSGNMPANRFVVYGNHDRWQVNNGHVMFWVQDNRTTFLDILDNTWYPHAFWPRPPPPPPPQRLPQRGIYTGEDIGGPIVEHVRLLWPPGCPSYPPPPPHLPPPPPLCARHVVNINEPEIIKCRYNMKASRAVCWVCRGIFQPGRGSHWYSTHGLLVSWKRGGQIDWIPGKSSQDVRGWPRV